MNMNIKIEPFSEFAACPKCGEADEGHSVPVLSLNARPDDDHLLPPVRIRGMVNIQTRYCPGGLEPEAKEQDPSLKMVSAMASMIGSKQVELGQTKLNICASITTEHLHKTCSRCHYEFLTETKDRVRE